MGVVRDYYEILGVDRSADEQTIKGLIGSLRRNIILTPIRGMLWQKKNLRRQQRRMRF